jgi:hypothetical protein
MALIQSVGMRARAVHDRPEPSYRRGIERTRARSVPTAIVRVSAGADTTQVNDAPPLSSFAVITMRNDTTSPVGFDLRALPGIPRFLTFHLRPGQERVFFSTFTPGIDAPEFQVEFLSIHGRAHTHSAQTLTEFNLLETWLDGQIGQGHGRLYVFRPTPAGRGLFLA